MCLQEGDKGDTFFGNSKRNTYQIYWKVKPKDQLSATIRFQMLYFKDRKVPTAASEYNLKNIIIIFFFKNSRMEKTTWKLMQK